MQGSDLFFIIVIIIIVLKVVSSSRGSKSSKIARKRQRRQALRNRPTTPRTTRATTRAIYQSRQRPSTHSQPTRQTPRARSSSLRQQADRALQKKDYEKAKSLYIQTGHTFSAAKAVALKGDSHIQEAIDLVVYYSADKSEEIVRNLARYFYDVNDFTKAALFLRGIGLADEARAILTVSGTEIPEIIDSRQVRSTPSSAPSYTPSPIDSADTTPEYSETVQEVVEEDENEDISEQVVIESGSQPLRIASSDLQERCSVCRGPIRSGQSFVSCPHCDSSAHYSHLMEWIKVKAQCPHCRQKLRTNYFQNH
jgi:hypothetical protein